MADGFCGRFINVIEALPYTKVGNHIGGQRLRSGASPAANYGEAQGVGSRKDFIDKMKIAWKELREALIWLRIIERKELCDSKKLTDIKSECD